MTEAFVDYVKIYFKSGDGGKGIVHWRREKHVPMGGPDGGDGGNGGSIILKGNAQLWTLLDLKYRKFITADNGNTGEGAKRKGRDGANMVLDVPLGVVVRDDVTGEVIGEITKDGQELLLLPGGKGGLGNWHFRSATNQAPDHAQPGIPGLEMETVIELKMLADVGLVGFPNAGKSTLLSVLSAARPKIADYAFTTLVPNLGIVRNREMQSFVMADIPGIIEGASEGKGLGTKFLRHIERNHVLLFLIPADAEEPYRQYEILLNELEVYNPELMHTPRVVTITKTDLVDEERLREIAAEMQGINCLYISAAAQQGLTTLTDTLWKMLNSKL
jgi:GTP-binding protein